MNLAAKPNFHKIKTFVERKKDADITLEEQQLYAMSQTAGWGKFVQKAEDVKKQIEGINKTAIESGASFEDIGRNTLVISMAQDIIKRLLDVVDDAVDACKPDGKQK
jgi:hypothetical protein